MRWLARLDEAPHALDEPLVWIVRHAEAERWPLPPAEPADRADAALARRDGGGGRLLRRRLLRALVGRVLALHPSAVRFTRDARGAPGLDGLAAFISAAGCTARGEAWSAVALSPCPVGVDLEAVTDTGADTGPLARWTLTEAYLKALGRGLAVPPEQVGVARGDGEAPPWRLSLEDAPPGEGRFRSIPPILAAAVVLRP